MIASKILLAVAIIIILLSGWSLFNNEIVCNMVIRGLNAIKKYHEYKIDENIDDYDIDMVRKDYDAMLYDYDYLFYRPWIKSAIKPEYRELLSKWECCDLD